MLVRVLSLFSLGLLAGACTTVPFTSSNVPSALNPQGPNSAHIASLWWVMVAFGLVIFIIVVGVLVSVVGWGERGTSETAPDTHNGDTGRSWVIRGGIILPIIVLSIVFGYTIYTLAAVENPQDQPAMQIKIVARRWWWEVRYPDQGVTTANEIHLPVGVPVQVQLDSIDVIHSLWVPELNGKMDVIPGRTNYLTLQADKVGVFRGDCAEYCGLQHALMGFLVVVQTQADFNNWLAVQGQPAATPADPTIEQGQKVFISAGCDFCHTIRGLDQQKLAASSADLGPDLTHLDSRQTIVGASLTNNTSNLAGWVIDAQHIKPGSDMPKMSISSQDLQDLLAYLHSLK